MTSITAQQVMTSITVEQARVAALNLAPWQRNRLASILALEYINYSGIAIDYLRLDSTHNRNHAQAYKSAFGCLQFLSHGRETIRIIDETPHYLDEAQCAIEHAIKFQSEPLAFALKVGIEQNLISVMHLFMSVNNSHGECIEELVSWTKHVQALAEPK